MIIFPGQSTILQSVNHPALGIELWSYFRPSQPFWTQSTITSLRIEIWSWIQIHTFTYYFAVSQPYFNGNQDLAICLNPVDYLKLSQYYSIENRDLIIDSNWFWAQPTNLFQVNPTPMGIEIWSYYKPNQPFCSQLTILHWESRFDPRFKLNLSLVNHFDTSQPYFTSNQDLIIFWAQFTNLQSVKHTELRIENWL